MSSDQKTEVLVVGAGPVGLLTALCLADRGIDVSIVDKYHRSVMHSYALALHPATLTLLDQLGMAKEVVGLGHKVERIALHDANDVVGELDLRKLDGAYPFVIALSQSIFESLLEARLKDGGVKVRWNQPLVSFVDDGSRVRSIVARYQETVAGFPDSRRERVRQDVTRFESAYLVGTDGYHSLVRNLVGFDYEGIGRQMTFSVVEFGLPTDLLTGMSLVFGRDSTDVLWPLAENRGRWNLETPDGGVASDEARLKELLRSRAPWFNSPVETSYWLDRVAFERRLASQFTTGRVWLAGDAIHMTAPHGAQSMNVGLREAFDVATRLRAILRDGHSAEELQTRYNEQRRTEWRRLLGADGSLEATANAPAWAGKLSDRLLYTLPASGRELRSLLRQVGLEFTEPRVNRSATGATRS